MRTRGRGLLLFGTFLLVALVPRNSHTAAARNGEAFDSAAMESSSDRTLESSIGTKAERVILSQAPRTNSGPRIKHGALGT